MHPILGVFHVGPRELPLSSYGVLVCIGLCVAAGGSLRVARRLRLDLGACIAWLGLGCLGAFAGGLALHGLAQWMRLGSLGEAVRVPGVASLGAVLGLLATLPLAARWLRLPLFALTDRALPAIAAGHAFGRLGCLLGGCCFGAFWDGPLAMHYTHPLAPAAISALGRHPVPLYEAAALFSAALVLAMRPPDAPGSGRRTRRYLIGYLLLRLGLECLRGDEVRGVFFDGAVSIAQLTAAALLVGAACWRVAVARGRSTARIVRLATPLVIACCSLAGGSGASAQRWLRLPLATADTISIASGWSELGSDAGDVEFAIALCKQTADDASICGPGLFSDEQPRHRGYVTAFQIDRTEVSRGDYQRCVQDNACPPLPTAGDGPPPGPERPAALVSWPEARGYCAWRGGRLPTEAEWERAARGDGGRRFPWGAFWNPRLANHGTAVSHPREPITSRRSACGPDCDGFSAAGPVTGFPDGRSPFGLLQMAGNVWEWTADRYDLAADARVPPAFAIRGGSWRSPGYSLRVTQRAGIKPDERRPDVGIRCAYDAP
jgi:formylglycine-generating enzyme required for sulfatase activity/prolipoprotein diacylglyceryltransferase